jgi:hypothetical protein
MKKQQSAQKLERAIKPPVKAPAKIKFLVPQDLKKIAGAKTLQFAYDAP